MKKTIHTFSSLLLLLTPVLSYGFSNGSGTLQDPYIIEDCQGLQSIIGFPSEHFKLGNDIDCTGFDYGDGGGFMPIGSNTYPFIGFLDGDDYVISNLYINRPTRDFVGLIAYTWNYQNTQGVIHDLKITNSIVIGRNSVGGVIGMADGAGETLLENISFEGEVRGNEKVGGLIGDSRINILNAYANVIVTATANYAGGLVGLSYGDIANSYATGEIKSTAAEGERVGGLVGWFTGGNGAIFDRNFADCIVSGYSSVGGLIGEVANSKIVDSYALGQAYGDHHIGGLIGNAASNNTITNTYAATFVQGNIYAGGLVGYGSSTVNNSYWDKTVSGQSFSAGGTPKTTEEMYQQTTFVDWDFVNTWDIENGVDYPQLQWSK